MSTYLRKYPLKMVEVIINNDQFDKYVIDIHFYGIINGLFEHCVHHLSVWHVSIFEVE